MHLKGNKLPQYLQIKHQINLGLGRDLMNLRANEHSWSDHLTISANSYCTFRNQQKMQSMDCGS